MKKIFAQTAISFFLAIVLVPLFVPQPTHADPTDPPSIIISLSAETVGRSGSGTSLAISTSLDGAYTSQYLVYNVYIARNPSTSEPTQDVTNASVWERYTVDLDNNVTLSDDEIFDGVSNHALPTISWGINQTTSLGIRYIKATISDSQGALISSAVTSVLVVENLIAVDLTANNIPNYIDYNMEDSSAQAIAISAAMTPPDEITSYKGELWISEKGYANSDDKSVSDAAHFAKVGELTFEKSSTPQSYNFFWDVKIGPSALGFHEVFFKVYGDGKFLAKTTMWIKLYKPSNETRPPTEGDTSKLNLSGALGAVGINVDFTSYKSVVTFLKDKWFPTIVGMFAFLGIIYSAWLYIMSAGDQAKADKGKKGLVYSIIGIAIAVGANVIINVATNAKDKFANATSIVGDKNSIFSKTTDLIAVISGMLAFIYLIYSGILYLTAAGNPDNAKKGLQGVINASIGIVIIVAAWAIIGAVTGTLGSYFK